MRKVVFTLSMVLVVGALIVSTLCQQARIKRAVAEAAMLREQLRQEIALEEKRSAGEPERGDATQPDAAESARAEEHRELLRLRGEVTVLRRQLDEARANSARAEQQVPRPPDLAKLEADLNDEQRKVLSEMMVGVKTGNSVSDLPRLKDGVERWEELHDLNRAPPEVKAALEPVFAILKERVKERIAELEKTSKQ